MTVGDLITILSQYDKEREIEIYDYDYCVNCKIDKIKSEGEKVILIYE